MGSAASTTMTHHRDRHFEESVVMESDEETEFPEPVSVDVRRLNRHRTSEPRRVGEPALLEPASEEPDKPTRTEEPTTHKIDQLTEKTEELCVSNELLSSLGFNSPHGGHIVVSQCNALYDSAVLPPSEVPPKPETPQSIDDVINERSEKVKSALEKMKSFRGEITAENLMTKSMYDFRAQFFTIYNSFLILKGKPMETRRRARQIFADEIVDQQVLDIYLKVMEIIFDQSPTEKWHVTEKGEATLRYRVFYCVILTIYNFANLENFASEVCRADGMVEFLKHIIESTRDNHMTEKNDMHEDKITKAPLGIFYNCSTFYCNREILQNADIIVCVQPFLNSPNESFQVSALVCTAYLADEKQSEIFSAKPQLISFFMNRLKNAMTKDDRMFVGWTVLEMVRGVGQLALNDTNKRLLAESEALNCLFEIVKQMKETDEISESLKAIWTLSFDEQNRKQIASNTDWLEILETCRRNDDDRHVNSKQQIVKIINGIQWTLNKSSAESISNKSAAGDGKHIMISYQWADQTTVKNIKNYLSSVGFNVWIDIEQMGGSTLDSMAAAVQGSTSFLMCVSHKYKDSQNCRAEAQYAFTLGRRIIPLMMQPHYKPDGWLGLIMGSKLYYNFSKPKHFQPKITELVCALKKIQSDDVTRGGQGDEITAETVAPVTTMSGNQRRRQDGKQYSQEQVDEWMCENNINKEKFGKLTSSHLAFLKNIKHEVKISKYQSILFH
ncbi:uncharacterized protein LOC141912817 [Tubulanus polymorphus]|uniref:uncharacterized protein LOC141912817 n=1 Tax=Tubulanus polymorphus TaxID=672921 RepID=UPI003DA65DD4